MYSFVSNEDDDYFLIHEAAAKMAGIPEKFVTMDARETGEYKLIIDYRAGASPAQKAMLHKHYDFLLDTISIPDRPCLPQDGREIEMKLFDIPSFCLHNVTFILRLGVLRGKEIADALNKRGIHDEYFNRKILDVPKAIDAPETPQIEDASPPSLPLITWKATDADFAELVKALYDKGYIEASSLTDALNIAAPHFSRVSPKAKNLTQGILNRRDLGKAGKFDGIPNAGKPKKKK